MLKCKFGLTSNISASAYLNCVPCLFYDSLQDHHDLIPDDDDIYSFDTDHQCKFGLELTCPKHAQNLFSSVFVPTLFWSIFNLHGERIFRLQSRSFFLQFGFGNFLPLFQEVSCTHSIEWTLLVNLLKIRLAFLQDRLII